MKRALWWGIDKYGDPDNNLNCCVSDAKAWKAYLESLGFEVELLLDSEATRYNILTKMGNLAAIALPGDHIAIGFSHHGTNVMDRSGDEPDGYDEALFVYPADIILDDEMREALNKFPDGAHITVVADICFSGTVTRMALVPMGRIPPRIRYARTDFIPLKAHRKKKFLEEEDMNHILLAACGDDEYSYEGAGNGVFTSAALNILKQQSDLTCKLTGNEFDAAIREKLPSPAYPQTAHVEGPETERIRKMFTTDNGGPQPEPDNDKPGCRGVAGILIGLGVGAVLVILHLFRII